MRLKIIFKKNYEPGKKNKNQITTRHKRKIKLYLHFTILTKLSLNYILQTDQFSSKVRNGFSGKQEASLICICKNLFKLSNII